MSLKPVCPVAVTARILDARWTLQIIHNLRQHRRFCQLQKLVGASTRPRFPNGSSSWKSKG